MGDYTPEKVAEWIGTMGSIIPHRVVAGLQSEVVKKGIDGRSFSDLVNRSVLTDKVQLEASVDFTFLQQNKIRKAWHGDFPDMAHFTFPPPPEAPAASNATAPPTEAPAASNATAPPSSVGSTTSCVTQLQLPTNNAPNGRMPPTTPRMDAPLQIGYPAYGPPMAYPPGYGGYPAPMGYYPQYPMFAAPATQDWGVAFALIERLVQYAHLDRHSAYMAIQDLLPPEVWSNLYKREGSLSPPRGSPPEQPEAPFDGAVSSSTIPMVGAASSSSIAPASQETMSQRGVAGLALLQGALAEIPAESNEEKEGESELPNEDTLLPQNLDDERPIKPMEGYANTAEEIPLNEDSSIKPPQGFDDERPIKPMQANAAEEMPLDANQEKPVRTAKAKSKPGSPVPKRPGAKSPPKSPGARSKSPSVKQQAGRSGSPRAKSPKSGDSALGSDGHLARSAAQVAELIRGMPESQVPEKQREEMAAKIESDDIDGVRFSKLVDSHGLNELGVGGRQAIQVGKFWKNVLEEDAMRKAVANVSHEPSQKAVKMIC